MWLRSNSALLGTNDACDIAFHTGCEDGQTSIIYAHKQKLGAESAVFNAMFCGPLKESQTVVRVTDIDPSTFLEMLK